MNSSLSWKSVIVMIPAQMTKDTVFVLLDDTDAAISAEPQLIVFDFSKLVSLQVGSVTVICNLTALCRQIGIYVEFKNIDKCLARRFVIRSGLKAFGHEKLQQTRTTDQFLPIRLVEYSRSHGYTHNDLVPWLAERMGFDPRALATLGACFAEVFNNIRDHSSFNVGCSAAHFNPAKREVTICFSDFGIGIPARIRTAKPNIRSSDHNAIVLACEEGFTTKTTPRNRGAGLHVLSNYVVERNQGMLIITSGEGIYTCLPRKRSAKRTVSNYPGTMIHITLQAENFKPDDVDQEDFTWD